MQEIFILHLCLHLEDETRSGFLGNETIIKPDLNVRIIFNDKFKDEQENVVFFLSMNYAKHILEKLRTEISKKYKKSQVDYDIKSIDVPQEMFNKMMIDPWKFEKA